MTRIALTYRDGTVSEVYTNPDNLRSVLLYWVSVKSIVTIEVHK